MKDINKIYYQKNILLALISIILTFCSSPIESESSNRTDLTLEKQLELMAYEELSDEEIEGLRFMREEEKLARDVYFVLYEKWGLKPFNNISSSEQRHMDAVKMLLDRYSIDDPVQNEQTGKFMNEELLNLYNNLVAKGDESLVAALRVGAAIEEIDILDLENQINNVVDNEDIKFVYSNLLRGSRNHLRAFVRNLNSQGENYEPQYIDIESFNKIISDEIEKSGKGKNKRKGRRVGMETSN